MTRSLVGMPTTDLLVLIRIFFHPYFSIFILVITSRLPSVCCEYNMPTVLHKSRKNHFKNLCPEAITNHRHDHPYHSSVLNLHKLFLKISQPKFWSKQNEEVQHPPVHVIGIKEMLVEISTFT